MPNYLQQKSQFYKLLNKAAIKYNAQKQVTWRNSTIEDIKRDLRRIHPRAEQIIKQMENKKPKEKSIPSYEIGRLFDKMYLVNISYEWHVEGKPWLKETTQIRTHSPEAENLERAAEEAAYSLASSMSQPQYEIFIRNVTIESVQEVKHQDSLADIPVFRYVYHYPNLKLYDEPIDNNCAYHLLLTNYPRRSKSIEHLEAFFGKKQNEGLTPNDMLRFCEHHDLSCYVMDLLGKAIVHRKRSNKRIHQNREEHALICTIASSHCYNIKDKQIRDKICKSVSDKDITLQGPVVERKLPEKDKETVYLQKIPKILKPKVYYINQENLNDQYMKFLDEGKAYRARWCEDKVKSIYGDNFQIHASENYEIVKEACKHFEIEFENQSLCKLARQLFKKVKNWKESAFSPEVEAVFNDDLCKASAFNITWEVEIKDTVSALDIRRLYTAMAKNGDFFYIDVHTKITPFNNEITHGFYYVETKNYFPLKGNGWYDHQTIIFCLERELIKKEDIKYTIKGIPSKDIDKCLSSFIDYVYTAKNDQVKKHIINSLIGSFGIRRKQVQKCDVLTTSTEESYYYFWKFNGALIRTINTPNGNQIYRVTGFEDVVRFTNNLPIRMQIVQRGNLEAYKLYEHVKKTYIPIALQTDCVYYVHRKKDGKLKEVNPDKLGGYRKQKGKLEFNKPVPEVRIKLYKPKQLTWNTYEASKTEYFDYKKVLEYDRVLIKGFAGSGKSYTIKKLREHLKDDFAYCSFTHTASNNINGQTLHQLLGLNFMTGEICTKNYKQLIKKQGLIIDEISMVPLEIYRFLTKLPKDFKLYIFGDFRQLPPVEQVRNDYDHLLNQLVNGNQIILRKQCRADAKFANECIQCFDNNDFSSFKPKQQTIAKDQLNIVKTNLCRVILNEQMMEKCKPDNAIKGKGEFKYIYEGMPIIANHTDKELNIFNGEQYKIESIQENINIGSKSITHEQLNLFSPAYAITVNKAQGATIDIPYSIWEFSKMDKHAKYTALTRATNRNLISLYDCDISINEALNVNSGKTAFIYKITDGNNFYIGSTTRTIEERWNEHINSKENWKLYQYMREGNFNIEPVKQFNYVSDHQVKLIESYYIEQLKPTLNERHPYYNIALSICNS